MLTTRLSPQTAWKIAGVAGGLLGLELFVLFGLTFQPSWANGWPGHSRNDVFAIGITLVLAITELTARLGISALGAYSLARRLNRPSLGWPYLVSTIIVGIAAVSFLVGRTYATIHNSMSSLDVAPRTK